MISEAEIRRSAAALRIDPMVIDLDYSLAWFILGLSKSGDFFTRMVFKGGTCLRKCYFSQYRFSEDLDFTATKFHSPAEVEHMLIKAGEWISDHDGPDFRIQPIHFEIVDDEYGSESYQARIYYRGPLRWGGSPRNVKLDISRAEQVMLPANMRSIIHSYSDSSEFLETEIPCYCLEEVVAEKLRAVSGQRRFAVSRDLFDIYNLTSTGIDQILVKQILPEKFSQKGLRLEDFDLIKLHQRRNEFKTDWDRRLHYLVSHQGIGFDEVWESVMNTLAEVISKF